MSSHTKITKRTKEMRDPPFAKVKTLIQTRGSFTGTLIYTHRQVSGAQRTWGHYLTKIFRGQFSPQFLILVKGWVVTLGEQAADNLKERRSYGDRATGHRLETWGKGFFSRINHTEMGTLRDLPKIEKGGRQRMRGREGKEQWQLKLRHKDRALHQQIDTYIKCLGQAQVSFADSLSTRGCRFLICALLGFAPYLKNHLWSKLYRISVHSNHYICVFCFFLTEAGTWGTNAEVHLIWVVEIDLSNFLSLFLLNIWLWKNPLRRNGSHGSALLYFTRHRINPPLFFLTM